MIVVALIAGFILWYFYYGLECFINGALGGWELPFVCLVDEIKWNLPFVGMKYRLEYTRGDDEWAKMLPGPFHFMFSCVFVPLIPLMIYRVIYRLWIE